MCNTRAVPEWGGIWQSGGSVTIANNTICENSGHYGTGGILLDECTATITNNTFYNNSACRGGAIADEDYTTIITNNTVAGNQASWGGGVHGRCSAITNCILWGNANYDLYDDAIENGDVPSAVVRFSDVGVVNYSLTGQGNLSTDPLFADSAGRLSMGSPCIDAGDNGALPPEITTDLDGNVRVAASVVDMGAYEYLGPEPTPEGSNVMVTPINSATGTTPVALTFEEIAVAGGTGLLTSASGPVPAPGFQLGEPPTYYEITTTASYTGTINVCISYVGVSFPGPAEALRLFHYEDGQWVDRTTMVDTQSQTVCGVVTALSTFAVLAPQDTTPPVFKSLAATPNVLWPPTHKMVPIGVTWNVTDNLDANPSVVLKSITMNEGDEVDTYDAAFDATTGDGHTVGDIQVDAAGNIFLRSERAGTGAGRTYTLVYEAADARGNTATATVMVTVPHEAP